ncbi:MULTISPECIES: ABC transporter substrate-binding protein [unclassified Mesorhizobium]|uniref:ABC transporter substrate-binding protein n=5 Tax=Mesorhizobium TaxID=68287 RepID=UPI0007FB8FEF|nr:MULTISPECIES: ABC transporter substrate-binding protein [unclassified Mesorhizobium]TGV91350.1 ABC transporter substrate-binding protein [Mesorhizobium sp. M00.F.Ca.ET.158.01.1.1]AZO61100.1 ABC transporter substrate-binding protein [Mesorhizobium sp. M1A.F.Ca.IN.022.06.1.1]MCT2576843.1 ABC transporter substrate-binding protein [Mesorhizobium sp. P13.3]MDF3165781.1 ABC transporter substrate-binding protein [Mesorhizobium sp. P16.1]MDF3176019.1 ABC transporter substrate-binding protein [Mesor
MKFVTSLLNRRAFVALAAASMLAGAMHSAPASAADVTIPIIVKDTTSFYWQIVLAGARKAGKDLGINVPELGAQAETDVNGQISILENAVAGNPAAIVIAPTEAKALGKPIDEAATKVKVIGIDSSAESKAFTSFLTTDNVQGGRVAADGLAAAIGAANGGKVEGKVALITALPGAGSLEQRAQGFKEQLKAKYPGLELVADKYADGQATTGLNIATDLITANPDLKGIFASNLIMAQGVGQAIAENNLAGKVALIGFDSDEKLIKFLNDGVISGLVVQDPYRMGYDGIKTALAASKGEKVEANVDTGANLVTKDNMKDPKIDALLNPKLN